MRASADPTAEASAKAQEGFSAPTTRVAGIPSFHQGENGLNGVQLSNFSAVRTHADSIAEAATKLQEGSSFPTTAAAQRAGQPGGVHQNRVDPCGVDAAGEPHAAGPYVFGQTAEAPGAMEAIRELSSTVTKFVEAASEKEERTSSAIK